jgi:hypothetical protein
MEERTTGRLGALAFGGFFASYLLLHMLSFGAGWPHHASSYAHTPWAGLWNACLVFLGIGALLLAFGLRGPRVQGVVTARILLAAAGLLSFLLIWATTDRTPDHDYATTVHGNIHDLGATAAVAVLATAMYILCAAGRLNGYWQRMVGSSFVWPHCVTALGVTWMAFDRMHLPYGAGLVQRALLGFVVLWLLMVSVRAMQGKGDPADAAVTVAPSAD